MSITTLSQLAAFAAQAEFDSLPDPAIKLVQWSLLDFSGRAIGAADEPVVLRTLATVRELGGNAQASVLGTDLHTSAPQAALVNAIAAQALVEGTATDTLPQPTHSAAISTALAVGEWTNASGRELLTALIVAFELNCRLAAAPRRQPVDSSVDFTLGAALASATAAASRLLALPPSGLTAALDLASLARDSQAAPRASNAGALQTGQLATTATLIALLARVGAADADRASAGSHPGSTGPAPVTDNLGERWLLTEAHRFNAADETGVIARLHERVWPYLPRWKELRLIELVRALPELPNVGALAELLESSDGSAG
jgi:2-methylcitrate dehydratase PrpD